MKAAIYICNNLLFDILLHFSLNVKNILHFIKPLKEQIVNILFQNFHNYRDIVLICNI